MCHPRLHGAHEMAFGQVDPARLEGEALDRWYRRSPADIEHEREAAALQRYRDFFQRPDSSNPEDVGGSRLNDRIRSWGGHPTEGSDCPHCAPHLAEASSRQPGTTQLASSVVSCPSCHGRVQAPLPFPFPWSGVPGLRFPPGATPANPSGPHPKQCEVQNAEDTAVCSGLPTPKARALCRESASEREAYCIKTNGEVGWPPLQTGGSRR